MLRTNLGDILNLLADYVDLSHGDIVTEIVSHMYIMKIVPWHITLALLTIPSPSHIKQMSGISVSFLAYLFDPQLMNFLLIYVSNMSCQKFAMRQAF